MLLPIVPFAQRLNVNDAGCLHKHSIYSRFMLNQHKSLDKMRTDAIILQDSGNPSSRSPI